MYIVSSSELRTNITSVNKKKKYIYILLKYNIYIYIYYLKYFVINIFCTILLIIDYLFTHFVFTIHDINAQLCNLTNMSHNIISAERFRSLYFPHLLLLHPFILHALFDYVNNRDNSIPSNLPLYAYTQVLCLNVITIHFYLDRV